MTEEKIETEVKCDICGKEYKNQNSLKVHRYRDHPQPKEKKEEIKEMLKEEIKKQYLNIQDVQSIERIENMVAWFDDGKGNKISKIPDLIGLLVNEERNESIPTLLILAADGTFVPPFLISGFIGMFPEDQIFPDEPKPESEPETSPDILKSEAEIELQAKDGVQAQSVSPSIPEDQPKKKGFLGGVFKKKKTEPDQPKEVSKETKDLLNQLTNAAK
jgi:hypothetical protein